MTVEEIADALTARSWIPTAAEWALGNDLMVRRNALEPQRPPMPHQDGGVPWATQSVLWTEAVVRITDELLAKRTAGLPASPMITLLHAYAEPARGLGCLAEELQRAWKSHPLRRQRGMRCRSVPRQHLAPERAWLYLAWEAMREWEEQHLPTAERERFDRVTWRMMQVGAVIAAAVSGDVDL